MHCWHIIATCFIFCAAGCHGERVERIGNQVKASASGVDVPGAVFLMNDVILVDGVVFAFSAFFRSSAAVFLQIWRPVVNGSDPNELELIYQLRVIPSVLYAREDVYIESRIVEDCVRVRSGDRLGVFLEEGPGSVSYFFDPATPTALGHTLKQKNDTFTVGRVVSFDSLQFPYDFSLAAYVDTFVQADNSSDDVLVPCSLGLLIPPEPQVTLPPTTPTPPITGVPGATGRRGKIGLIGATGKFGPTGAQGIDGKRGTPGEMGPSGIDGDDGEEGGTGATGSEGEYGATGAAGPRGKKGDLGPVGKAGPPAVYPSGVPVTTKSSLHLKSALMMALLIWLIVVTIIGVALLISLLVIICCYESSLPSELMEKPTVIETLNRQSSSIYPPELAIDVDSWLETMKDQSVTSMDPVFIDVRSGKEKVPMTEFTDQDPKQRNSIYAPFAAHTIDIEDHGQAFSFDPSDQDSGIAYEDAK